jgi:capsular exopolysaccharide synthesis family protein
MKNLNDSIACDFDPKDQTLNIKINLQMDASPVQEVNQQEPEQEQPLNIKELLFRILNSWFWFALCGFLALVLTWIYNRNITPIWQVESTILVNEGSKKTDLNNLFESLNLGAKVNMQNHIELLKSYSLNQQTIENLNWRTSWFEKRQFIDEEYYKDEPYNVIEPNGLINKPNIPIVVNVISADVFEISCNFEGKINGEEVKIEFSQNGKLDVPIVTPDFCFTLTKGNGAVKPGSTYHFRFNEINEVTLGYCGKSKKMNVTLTDKTSEILKISVIGTQPSREVDFVNELTRVFIQYGLNEKNRTAENTVDFIETQLTGIADSLRNAGQTFTSYRTENQILDLSKEGGLVLDKLNDLESQKSIVDMRLVYYRNLKKYISSASSIKQTISPSVVGIIDPSLNSMVMKLAELYSRREILAYSVQDKNPALLVLDREIQAIRENLVENLTNLETNAGQELEDLKLRIKDVYVLLEKLPKTEQQFINYKRRYDINNQLYTLLLTKRAEAAIIKASNVADSRLIDKARLETAIIIGPNKLLNLLIGLILGLGTPLVIILISDYFNDTIKDTEHVKRFTSIPIIGEIGYNHYEKEFVTTDHPRSEITESFRSLRTNLQYVLNENGHNVIGIHSTIPGEGKSFISLNLASIIAMNNKKVLLVATDMRKPRLNSIFDIEHSKAGLSTYLIKHDEFNDVVRKTHLQNLNFVSSGPIPPNPAELLENERFKEFINEAKSLFDYVIIDNAPVPVVTDGFISSQYCDTNLFIVRQGYSHQKQVKYIDELHSKSAMPNINIVLNSVERKGYGYQNNYSNGYGSHTGYYVDIQRPTQWGRVTEKIKKILNVK